MSPVVEDVDTLLPKETDCPVSVAVFKDTGLMNTVPIPIEVTVVPAPVTPGIVFRVCPIVMPVVVIPLINVVVTPIFPDAVATPTKVVVVVVSVVVDIPLKIWSAFESIIATLIPFAQEPGFLAATITLVIGI